MKIISQNIDFGQLAAFAKSLYPADSIRQQQQESFNHVYLHAILIAEENGAIQARLAIYHNPHLMYEGKKVIAIGNYEAIDNQVIAKEILAKAEEIAHSLGGEILLGPMNGSTWDSYRFSADHDTPNFFLEPFHHLYYNKHFTENGFSRFATYFSSKDTTLAFDNPQVLERKLELEAQGMTIRTVDLANFKAELELLYDFNGFAFQKNFLYTPIDKESFVAKYMPIQKLVQPDFVLLAEDKNKELLSYFFCVPDFYNINEKSLIIKTIARHPDKKWYGLGHVLGNEIYRNAAAKGYQSIIHAFMYDAGFSTTITQNFSGERYKDYYLYIKEL
jgi:hypothetical protein